MDYNNQYSFNYLEAAPADIPSVVWCNNRSTSIPAAAGWSARAVGAGQANTNAMTMACTSGAANSAAAYSTSTTLAGDWFLGSIGDMILMFNNLTYAGVGDLQLTIYWSSSENTSSSVAGENIAFGNQSNEAKNSQLPVRAVRQF